MLANCLTKKGASAEGLLTVMTLYLRLPPAPTGTITLGGDTDDERRIHHSSLGGERKKGCIGHMYMKIVLRFFSRYLSMVNVRLY